MEINRQRFILFSGIILLLSLSLAIADESHDECTIGVASGKATTDGRPLLWKTRDNTGAPDNEIYYNTAFKYMFISVVSASSILSWMGVNETGFAILNSQSLDLPAGTGGMGNGSFMTFALGNCSTLDEFEHILDSTNVTGRYTQANFGVIDQTGAAAIYETGGNSYWKFDAHDTTIAPDGYLLRTNFAVNGGGNRGIERYRRTRTLVNEFYKGDTLNIKSLIRYQMRDFSDEWSREVSVPYFSQWSVDHPYGYVNTEVSICRDISVAAAVIQGILPGEDPRLSVMIALLGQPATSVFLPYWPVGPEPSAVNGNPTAPLCDVANQIRSHIFDYAADPCFLNSFSLLNETDGGLWTKTFPVEDSVLTVFESRISQWRSHPVNIQNILDFEDSLTTMTLAELDQIYGILSTYRAFTDQGNIPDRTIIAQNFPNPFNDGTRIEYYLPQETAIKILIYNSAGQNIETLRNARQDRGFHDVEWQPQKYASGLYFYQIITDFEVVTKKMLLLK